MTPVSYSMMVISDGDSPIVAFAGELDIEASDGAWRDLDQVLSTPRQGLTVDVRDVTFMDSRGLAVFIRAARALGPDRRVTLRAPRPTILRSIQLLGLDQLVDVELDLDERDAGPVPDAAG